MNGELKRFSKRAPYGRYVHCVASRSRKLFCIDSNGVYVQDCVLLEMRLLGKDIVAEPAEISAGPFFIPLVNEFTSFLNTIMCNFKNHYKPFLVISTIT